MLQAHRNSSEKVEENYFIQAAKRNILKISHIFWKIAWKSVYAFSRNVADRQTNRQANTTTSMKT